MSAFIAAATRAGYELEESRRKGEYAARVFRTEPTELDSIHRSVMTLHALAAKHGGYYDGWETSVEKTS